VVREPGWLVCWAGGAPSKRRVIARLARGAAGKSIGSDRYSAPAGIVTSARPEKARARSLAGSMRAEPGAAAKATWTPDSFSGSVPKALDSRTRILPPPVLRRSVWRKVPS
jgi:hypothetical protein